jgi:hypothetical protein
MPASLRREISIDIGLQAPRDPPPQVSLLVATCRLAEQLLVLGAQCRHRPMLAFFDLLQNCHIHLFIASERRP